MTDSGHTTIVLTSGLSNVWNWQLRWLDMHSTIKCPLNWWSHFVIENKKWYPNVSSMSLDSDIIVYRWYIWYSVHSKKFVVLYCGLELVSFMQCSQAIGTGENIIWSSHCQRHDPDRHMSKWITQLAGIYDMLTATNIYTVSKLKCTMRISNIIYVLNGDSWWEISSYSILVSIHTLFV